jgi:cytochrome c oxidase subunit 2
VAEQKGGLSSGAADLAREWSMKELMTRGESVYNSICAACHQPGGVGMPPTFPALKGSNIATGPVKDHIEIVENGKSGTAMQAFKNQLSDVELAAVITYERNAFGNNVGTIIQPVQMKALRDGKSMDEAMAVKPSAVGAAPAPAPATPTPSTTTPSATSAPAATQAAPAAPAPADDLKSVMARGEQVYLKTCVACHQQAGTGIPPTFPALKGGKITTGPVGEHIHQVLYGKQGTAMVAFKDQLNDQEIADVITYERNAWGNNEGKVVTPDQIKTARQQPNQ